MLSNKKKEEQITHLYTQIFYQKSYFEPTERTLPIVGLSRHSQLCHLLPDEKELAITMLRRLNNNARLKNLYFLRQQDNLVDYLIQRLPDQFSVNQGTSWKKRINSALAMVNYLTLNKSDKNLYKQVKFNSSIVTGINKTLLNSIVPHRCGWDKHIDRIAWIATKTLDQVAINNNRRKNYEH